ncbi:MAG: hypothetical protein COS97_02570 [Candidatus Nealsonbacteria bacterium CG07_land_8_20_14_0_80_40_10]|nr:MAG: hypothetical protein COS97_02570 [Candidatus Nealsonbacteria bacterium CG07_land_8_20_14_0_80_40_10]
MKILLHICCAPCSIYPVKILRQQDFKVMGFFYRHNIHPFTECLKRQETLQSYAKRIDLQMIYQADYDLEGFIQKMVFRESERCSYCYHERLRSAALVAKQGQFDYFTSTLLYSKFQQHDLLKSIGESIASSVGIPFFYQDFRVGWKEGIKESKRLELYRQQYCGCIYSEKERYYNK